MAHKRVQLNKVVKDQLPAHVREENPLVGEFLSQYYQAQEIQGGPLDIITNLDSYIQLNKSGNLVGFTTIMNPVGLFDTEISVKSTQGFPDSWGSVSDSDSNSGCGLNHHQARPQHGGLAGCITLRMERVKRKHEA